MAGMDTTALTSLVAFRSAQHAACGRRGNALFDVCDAVLTAGPVPSPAHVSLQPQHRRGWGSLYDALAVGAISGPQVIHSNEYEPSKGRVYTHICEFNPV